MNDRPVAGLVGVGLMGEPIAGHILRGGFELVCYDVDAGALKRVEEAGAKVASSPSELARAADVMLVVVPTDDDVLDVCGREDGLLSGARSGTVLAICSSTKPETCTRVGEIGARRGIGVVDVALTRGMRGARAGNLTLLAGGDRDALETITPVLEAFSGAIHHLGELGAGQVAKTVNNLIHWAQIAAIVEALRFGERLGVGPSRLRTALMDAGVDSRTLRELHLMPMTWPAKDLANALGMAEEIDYELPLTEVVRVLMEDISHDKVVELLRDPEAGD